MLGRSFHPAFEQALENLGPYCYEAVEVDLTVYHDNGDQESKLLFVGPTPHAIHEAQRRCMVEDVVAHCLPELRSLDFPYAGHLPHRSARHPPASEVVR